MRFGTVTNSHQVSMIIIQLSITNKLPLSSHTARKFQKPYHFGLYAFTMHLRPYYIISYSHSTPTSEVAIDAHALTLPLTFKFCGLTITFRFMHNAAL